MEIHFLDVGKTKYGDSILIKQGTQTILIDGGHPHDADLILSQLEELLNKSAPLSLDLLIVTHCHSDHIGCLPELITNGSLNPKMALVADENLGFGRDVNGDSFMDSTSISTSQKKLMMALQEEDHSNLSDAELERFIEDAYKLSDSYDEMLAYMKQNGIKVIRYKGVKNQAIKELENKFSKFGLSIIGPTKNHLNICADIIPRNGDFILNDSNFQLDENADNLSVAKLYRQVVKSSSDGDFGVEDRPGTGAAKNNQSIVLKVASGGLSALLAGDMQFAKPEISDLNELMEELLQKAMDNGPYDAIKTSHHTSYNGLDENVLNSFFDASASLFIHTGGLNDPGHPDKGALITLKANKSKLKFARTDHNGLVSIKVKNNKIELNVEKGKLNDFTPNPPNDEGEIASTITNEPVTNEPIIETIVSKDPPIGVIEIIARIPNTSNRVTLTIDVDPEKKNYSHLEIKSTDSKEIKIGGGRILPPLLFVTNSFLLSKNIGQTETNSILHQISSTLNAKLFDLPTNVSTASEINLLVRKQLVQMKPKGVVIVGGYDVIPSHQLDSIDQGLRNKLSRSANKNRDADDFVVWCDDLYGDSDNDLIAEFPVSRVPDCHSSDFLKKALSCDKSNLKEKFGVRNIQRPFAELVFPKLPGKSTPLFKSESFTPDHMPVGEAPSVNYFMLHGSEIDGSTYWGETQDQEMYMALTVNKIPSFAKGSIIFAGCCWGALSVYPSAARKLSSMNVTQRTPENSIALAYLKAGAFSFIGCTGSHYSPNEEPFEYYGKPIHDYFWEAIKNNNGPSEALFHAKEKYASKIPHYHTDDYSKAIEMKIWRQFTCLGLGW